MHLRHAVFGAGSCSMRKGRTFMDASSKPLARHERTPWEDHEDFGAVKSHSWGGVQQDSFRELPRLEAASLGEP